MKDKIKQMIKQAKQKVWQKFGEKLNCHRHGTQTKPMKNPS